MLFRPKGFCWGIMLGIGVLVLASLPCAGQEGRVWLSSLESFPGPSAHIELQVPEGGQPQDAPLLFDVAVVCEDSFDEVGVELVVTDLQGDVLHEGSVVIPLHKGANPVRFVWEPKELPDGLYLVQIAVHHPVIEYVAEEELRLESISWAALNEAITRAEQAMAQVTGYLEDAVARGTVLAFVPPKAAIAADAVAGAHAAANGGNWPRALYLARYAEQAAREVEAGLAFASAEPETAGVPMFSGANRLTVSGSLLEASGQPVFLIGGYLEHPDPASIEQLRRYGLNFASLSVAPAAMQGDENVTAGIDGVLEAAAANGVSVAVSARALDIPASVSQARPEALASGEGRPTVDLNSEAARQATAAHVAAVAAASAEGATLTALSVATSPRFSFGGEAVRAAFVERVEALYGDRLALNRAWRSNLRGFEDIDIWRDDTHLSYQFDWQMFHQELAGRYVRSLMEIADRSTAVPVTMTIGEEMLFPGESRYGVNASLFVPDLPLIACASRDGADDPYLALPYPDSELLISLLRSMNPDVPLFNLVHEIDCSDLYGPVDRRAYVRSLLWEDVITGASAVALAPWARASKGEGSAPPPVGLDPQCLEGAATAAQELNRLAPIVAALQREPAEVVIVWSPASKIQNNGVEYLQSIRNAYEGCSYGGRKVGFITEKELAAGKLTATGILVLPRLTAISEEAFETINAYIAAGGAVIRTSDPIPYTEHGEDLQDVLTLTSNLVLVRGRDTAVQYMHAMDAIGERMELSPVVHVRNAYRYLLEGVRTCFTIHEGVGYLYVLNMRHDSVQIHASHGIASGRDLVQGRDVTFPLEVLPLTPMLIRLDSVPPPPQTLLTEVSGVPTVVVEPIVKETAEALPPPRIHHPETGRGHN